MPLDWGNIAPMVVAVVLIVTAGGVMVLRPIAKRIGELLELYTRDKNSGVEAELHQVRELVETMNARLQLMEERQDFTDRLLSAPKKEKTDG